MFLLVCIEVTGLLASPFVGNAARFVSPEIRTAAAGIIQGGNANGQMLRCRNPRVIDGDTIECANERVRLAHIDAPEMDGHCAPWRRCTPGDPHAARTQLEHFTRGSISCRVSQYDMYGRAVATCRAAGRNLSCTMVRSGHAVERDGRLRC